MRCSSKLILLATILWLSGFTATLANDASTGQRDSIYVSYDDLRAATAKMVELEYTKQINERLIQVVANDSAIIQSYEENAIALEQQAKGLKTERNVMCGVAIVAVIGLILSIL